MPSSVDKKNLNNRLSLGRGLLSIIKTALVEFESLSVEADWEQLITIAQNQAISAIFYEGVAQYSEFQHWNPDKKKILAQKVAFDVTKQMQRTEAFHRIYQILLENGLRPIVLKGIVCRSLYGKFADYRPSGDEDLLIPKGQFPRCREILVANGFFQVQELPDETLAEKLQAISFYDTHGSGLTLEIHQNPFGLDSEQCANLSQYYEDAEQKAILLNLDGYPIYSLNHTDHYLFLFFHLYKHFIHSGVGIRQVIDLALYEKIYGEEIQWDIVIKKIQETSTANLYADILKLEKQMGFSPRMQLSPINPDNLLLDMLQSGVFGVTSEEQHYSTYVTGSSLTNGSFHFLRTLFPTKKKLLVGYPYLDKQPYLLPWVWIKRIAVFVFRKKKIKTAQESLKIGKERIRLFQEYNIL